MTARTHFVAYSCGWGGEAVYRFADVRTVAVVRDTSDGVAASWQLVAEVDAVGCTRRVVVARWGHEEDARDAWQSFLGEWLGGEPWAKTWDPA